MKLFEIAVQIEAVLATHVDHETGEITDEGIAALEELEMAKKEKALAVAHYLIGEKAEAEAVKAQAERLALRAASHNRRADRLLKYLGDHLEPGEVYRDDVVQLKWRKSTAVEMHESAEVPEEFLRVKTITEPDKPKIRDALKAGAKLSFAALVKRQHLSVA